jgi:hypothetical protein
VTGGSKGREDQTSAPDQEPDEGSEGEGYAEEEDIHITFGEDGLIRGWDDRSGEATQGYAKLSSSSRIKRTHPIYDLIKRGNEKWANLLER